MCCNLGLFKTKLVEHKYGRAILSSSTVNLDTHTKPFKITVEGCILNHPKLQQLVIILDSLKLLWWVVILDVENHKCLP